MKPLVLDFETCYSANLPWLKGSYPVSLCIKVDDVIKTYIFNHSEKEEMFSPEEQDEMFALLDSADLLIAHNLKFELHWLRGIGYDFSRHRLYCTMVAEYLLNNQSLTGISLSACSEKYNLPCKIDKVKEWWDSGYETYDIPLDILVPYGEQDVLNCEALYYKQIKLIKKQNKGQIVKLRCESLRVTQKIEWNGMHINPEICKDLSDEYGRKMEELNNAVYNCIRDTLPELADIPFSLTSGDHLSAILFGGNIKYEGREETVKELKGGKIKLGSRKAKLIVCTKGLGFTPAKRTECAKDGYFQTDNAQLDGLKCKTDVQRFIIDSQKELSKMDKMKGTYCDGLLKAELDGVVHPTINECVTATGRYSSKNPNSQNIPREGTSGVKKFFITRYT